MTEHVILSDFSNDYFDKAVVTIHGSFIKDIKNNYFENSLEDCFGNFNLIYVGRT